MAHNFHPVDRDQLQLFPYDLREWLPDDHFVWFLLDALAAVDMNPFYDRYHPDGKGNTAYDPAMMIGVLLYAFSTGTFSSRQIERNCQDILAYRILSAHQMPDHTTICRFRRRHSKGIREVFLSLLRLCKEQGFERLGRLSLDGTKLKGNASLDANRTKRQLRKMIDENMKEAERQDSAEDRRYGKGVRGDELPPEVRKREGRVERLRASLQRLEAEDEAAKQQRREEIEAKKAKEEARGRKFPGRKLKDPESMVNEDRKANITDPDSRIMKTRQGFVQGYNAQALVSEDQFIIAADVTQDENDRNQLLPMLDLANRNLEALEIDRTRPLTLMADAGYWSEKNATSERTCGYDLHIATKKDRKQREELRALPPPRGRIPKSMGVRERMDRKLRTKRGRENYRKRGWMSEGVFGQIKEGLGMDRFLRRGLEACREDWMLFCAAFNLRKLWNKMR